MRNLKAWQGALLVDCWKGDHKFRRANNHETVFGFDSPCCFREQQPGAGVETRSIQNIPAARESLLRTVSPKFYQTLLISPVEGWIVVRGWLAGNHLTGLKIIHSELNGEHDSLALDLARNLEVLGLRLRNGRFPPPVLVHVLIYQINGGKLALSFAHSDESGGTQMRYYGAAWMAGLKANHLWETIEPLTRSPFEHRGPRSYKLLAVAPGAIGLERAVGRVRRFAR